MVIAVSEKARRNYVLRQGIKEEKTAAIYNGICLEEKKCCDRITIRRELGLSESAAVIGMFGRLVKEKGYSDVVLAAGEVLRHTRNVQFLVVGEGAERENLEVLVKSKGLEKNVIFAGFRQDTSNIMESMDLLVQPSWTESNESFGLVLIEAMAAGKPVIASNIEPFFEIVEDGKNGLLFPEKNYSALAQKIILLLSDRRLMDSMGRCGYEIVKEKFDARIIARKTEDVYEQVLGIKK
jgi:glycosyltransferase involved in cell wall biosynthesis